MTQAYAAGSQAVARGVSPSEVFAAVAEEMARCLNVRSAEVLRYEDDGAAIVVVSSDDSHKGSGLIGLKDRIEVLGG